MQDGRVQDGQIQDGCHHQVNWIELVWVRVRVEWECFWVNLREDNKVSECKMAVTESNMAEFRMAAIIKLSQNEQVKFFLFKMAESKMAAIIQLSQNEQGKFFVQNGWIQDGRIHYGCHHLVNWIELVWVRVRVEWECFSVNLREDNKVFESKMAVSESNMAEFKMAAITKLSENEWVKFFLYIMAELRMADFKIAAIIKLSQNEWVKFLCKCWELILASVSEFERKNYDGWIQHGQIQVGRIQEVKWEWMSLSQIELVWVRVRVKSECFWVNLREENKVSESKMAVSESNMAEFKMAAIIKLSENEWVKFFLYK